MRRGDDAHPGMKRFGQRFRILRPPDLVDDQHIRRHRADHHHDAFRFRAPVHHIRARPDIEAGHSALAARDLRSFVNDGDFQSGPFRFRVSPGTRADLTGQISDQRRFSLLGRRQNQRVQNAVLFEIQQMRKQAVGDSANLSGNPHVKAADITQMLHLSSAQYGSPGQSDPVSAGDRNKAFAQLLLHRIKRVVRDEIEQTVPLRLSGDIGLRRLTGQPSFGSQKVVVPAGIHFKRTPLPDPHLFKRRE
ncbi:hypothetical protein D1872_249010 [compost metagenome]